MNFHTFVVCLTPFAPASRLGESGDRGCAEKTSDSVCCVVLWRGHHTFEVLGMLRSLGFGKALAVTCTVEHFLRILMGTQTEPPGLHRSFATLPLWNSNSVPKGSVPHLSGIKWLVFQCWTCTSYTNLSSVKKPDLEVEDPCPPTFGSTYGLVKWW